MFIITGDLSEGLFSHRFSSATETCPYLSFSRLDEAADKAHSDSLLVSYMFLTLLRSMGFSLKFDTIKPGWSIICSPEPLAHGELL